MSRRLLLLLVAGCGRVAFDRTDDGRTDEDAGTTTCPSAFSDVSTGRGHTCAVDSGGHVWCWGANHAGQVLLGAPAVVDRPLAVPLAKPAAHVATGREHSCARFTDGTVSCWGSDIAKQLGAAGAVTTGAPTDVALGDDRALDISAGAWHTCARRASDQAVLCWGDNRHLTLGVLAPSVSGTPLVVAGTEGTRKVTTGHRHNCLIDVAGRVQCWGRNQTLQLGSTTGDRATPQVVSSIGTVTDIAIAGGYSCAIDATTSARCWGRADGGQLGPGTFTNTATASPAITSGATALYASGFGACALHTDGAVDCWGKLPAGDGQLSFVSTPRPSVVRTPDKLASGYFHSCAIEAGTLRCWGINADAELGRGTRSYSTTPIDIALPNVSAFAAGRYHACATSNDQLHCWGLNTEGQFGQPNRQLYPSPTAVASGLATVDGIAVHDFNTCAWSGGLLRCVGKNDESQLGTVGSGDSWVTTIATNVSAAAVGRHFACAIVGTVVNCWGRNSSGQLGRGTNAQGDSPAPLAGGSAVTNPVAIAAGLAHACVIDGGTVKCWGFNGQGQLGDGTTTDRRSPIAVTLPAAASSISLGTVVSCARLITGAVYCWGYNESGDLGTGLVSPMELSPVLVALPGSATAVWVADNSSCAKLATGEVYCWGDGQHGELGDGMERFVLLPEAISTLASATTMSRSWHGGCALRAGTLACWGGSDTLGNGDVSAYIPAPPLFPGCE